MRVVTTALSLCLLLTSPTFAVLSLAILCCFGVAGFRLLDPLANELVTIRDLLAHRTGLPRHDLALFTTSTREDLIRRYAPLPFSLSCLFVAWAGCNIYIYIYMVVIYIYIYIHVCVCEGR